MTSIKTLLLLFIAATLVACSSGTEPVEAENEPVTQGNDNFVLTQAQFNGAGMQLAKLEPHDFYETVKATGVIEVPPENKITVSAYFGGYVKGLTLLPGEAIRRGQVLFSLENPEFVQVQQDFLETKGQLNYLQSDFERQQNLVQDNVTSQKNFLKAEADFNTARARLESLKKKLTLMNINPETLTETNIRTTIPITAPISGYVTDVSIDNGMFLNPSDEAISLINTDHLHVELQIFENDLPLVSPGQNIQFRVQNSNRTYEARLELINRSVNQETRTVMLHADLVNEKEAELLTAGMFVEADIYTTGIPAPALPDEAIVNIDDQYFVLIKTDGNNDAFTLEQREAMIGRTTAGYTEITNADAFSPETEFVTKGAFNLISE